MKKIIMLICALSIFNNAFSQWFKNQSSCNVTIEAFCYPNLPCVATDCNNPQTVIPGDSILLSTVTTCTCGGSNTIGYKVCLAGLGMPVSCLGVCARVNDGTPTSCPYGVAGALPCPYCFSTGQPAQGVAWISGDLVVGM